MKSFLEKLIENKRFIILMYVLFVLITTVQSLTSDGSTNHYNGVPHTDYNNYVIFKSSFDHLQHNQDLYILHPQDHFDLFKYTPTYAAFFGLFSVLPDWLGLSLWGLLNVMILLASVYYLPKLTPLKQGLILVSVSFELITSIQNEQSNGLIVGLLVLAFGLLEHKKLFWASMCIVFAIFIKPFGLVGLALFLFYSDKWKLALYTSFWILFCLALPLIWIDMEQYQFLYESFLRMLGEDHDASYGYSVMGIIYTWFSIDINKNLIVLIGATLFLVPFIKHKSYQFYKFRFLGLTSILIWIVIFNHKAESPTFIIAMAGVCLWYFMVQRNKVNTGLFIFAIVLTSLSATDLFPPFIREGYVKPYALKALPCILIWIKISYDMIVYKEKPDRLAHIQHEE